MNIGNMAKSMNDVERYSPISVGDSYCPCADMDTDPDGEWVSYAAYAALQQQLAAAREALSKESAMREEMADAVGNLTTPAQALGDVEVLGKQYIANARPNAAFVRYEDYMPLLAFAEAASDRAREAEANAARYLLIAKRWQHQKTSESELLLMTLGLEGDVTGRLDDIIDATLQRDRQP